MITTRPLTMADAETRLVSVHGYEQAAARALLRKVRDAGSYDADDFSVDYSLTGARYGRGHFTFMEDNVHAEQERVTR